jgi:hypothetical protein
LHGTFIFKALTASRCVVRDFENSHVIKFRERRINCAAGRWFGELIGVALGKQRLEMEREMKVESVPRVPSS